MMFSMGAWGRCVRECRQCAVTPVPSSACGPEFRTPSGVGPEGAASRRAGCGVSAEPPPGLPSGTDRATAVGRRPRQRGVTANAWSARTRGHRGAASALSAPGPWPQHPAAAGHTSFKSSRGVARSAAGRTGTRRRAGTARVAAPSRGSTGARGRRCRRTPDGRRPSCSRPTSRAGAEPRTRAGRGGGARRAPAGGIPPT